MIPSIDRCLLAGAIVFAATLLGGQVMSQDLKSSWPVGSSLDGWLLSKTGTGNPKWSIEPDASSPRHTSVLKQSGVATYPVALWQGQKIKDGRVQTTFKAIEGREDKAGGLIWRARDANNYYVVRANALEDNVVAYKTVNGTRTPLGIVGRAGGYGVATPVLEATSHTLSVAFQGSRFTVFFNDQELFQVEDTTYTEEGYVGLWTKADSVTVFSEFAISNDR